AKNHGTATTKHERPAKAAWLSGVERRPHRLGTRVLLLHGVVLIMTLAVGARRGTARRHLPARETCESREIKREIATLDPARRGNRDLIAGMPGLHAMATSSSHVCKGAFTRDKVGLHDSEDASTQPCNPGSIVVQGHLPARADRSSHMLRRVGTHG